MLEMKNEADLIVGAEVYHLNERNGAPLLKLGDGLAAKLFPRKVLFQHLLRVVFNSTKAHKQWKAAMSLLSLGLNTPTPVCVKVFDGRGLYEASYVYKFLEDAEPFSKALESSGRLKLLDKLALELGVMYQAGVLFLDFHLENVLVDAQGELWWIDAEFTYNRSKVKDLFWARMQRMHQKCDPGVLSLDEWEYFCQQLRKSGC